MKKIKLLLSTFLVAGLLQAQTADDVIGKYVEAMGGSEKLQSIQSLYMEGVAVSPNGMEITSKTYKVQGKLYRQEVDFGMGTMTTLLTDKEGWFSNPRNGGSFEAMPAEMKTAQQSELDCVLPLVDYAAKGHKAELTGTEEVNGVTCYVIKLTLNTGRVINYYIGNKDWLIVQSSTTGGRMMFGGGGARGGGENRPAGAGAPPADMVMKTEYADYKKTSDGFLFPMTITRPGMGGRGMSTTIEKVEVNKPVDEKLFKPE
jgi:outer membrane lipoprotein-sorting protein